MKISSSGLLTFLAICSVGVGGCPSGDGSEDAGPGPNTDAGNAETYTAADIGQPCFYRGDGVNPTSQCAQGLSCFIESLDGAYSEGIAGNRWFNQLTSYEWGNQPAGDTFVDEGYCTLVGKRSDQRQIECPAGTFKKEFAPDTTVCLRLCESSADCRRDGYVCDVRYEEVRLEGSDQPMPTCVRACVNDAPDCVRSFFMTNPQAGSTPTLADSWPVLWQPDLDGGRTCNQATGQCETNLGNGTVPLGGRCSSSTECAGPLLCVQGTLLGEPVSTTDGFCSLACQPQPYVQTDEGVEADQQRYLQQNQAVCQGPEGPSICQAAFRWGHVPFRFAAINPATGMQGVGTAGGFCFPHCYQNPAACADIPGTTCNTIPDNNPPANPNAIGESWAGVVMCLQPEIVN